jgi:hypothetical protein
MKSAFAVCAALLLGLVLGSWALRSDLREARRQADELRRELDRRGRSTQGLDGIATMLRIPDAGAAGRRASSLTGTGMVAAATGRVDSASGPTGKTAVALGDARRFQRPPPEQFRERLETAAAAWKTRSDLARSAFVSNVAPSDEAAARFDVIIAAMNMRLSNSVQSWVQSIRQNEQAAAPETGVRMFHDLSGALVLTYDELDQSMPAGWREKAGPEFKVMDFINPEVVLPLADVEGRFIDSGPERGRAP